MIKKYWIPVLLLLIGISACLDEIDLDVPAGSEQGIVIQGSLKKSDDGTEVLIDVSRVFDFTSQSRIPVNVSNITLFDNLGNNLALTELSEGLYGAFIVNNDPSFPITIGNSYHIRFTTFDGRTIESTPELLRSTPQPTALDVDETIIEVENNIGDFVPDTLIRFSVTTPVGSTGQEDSNARLLWELENTFRVTDSPLSPLDEIKTCYVTNPVDVNVVKIFDGNELNTSTLNQYSVYETPIDSRFAEGFYLTVIQQSISADAFKYWDQIQQLIERTGNFFESPPGTIVSNFQNLDNPNDNIYGFFYATEEKVIRAFVSPTTAMGPTSLCPPQGPPPPGGGCGVELCCNCLSAEQSTLEQPIWWKE